MKNDTNMVKMFKNLRVYLIRREFSQPTRHYDKTQLNLMNEVCILVDQNDSCIGSASKKDCHLIENINKNMLHRAFSVFLFDSNKRLLLQQRSLHKITYPNHWTNACCSHPLYIESEMDTKDDIGIKNAARRRLSYELGIAMSELDVNSFNFLTRIQYKAENVPKDGIFGENEIDYVLFLNGDYHLHSNKNEIKDTRYFTMYELKEFLEEEKDGNSGVLLTPWFKLICDKFLFKWWSNLDKIESFKDHKNIHRFV